ncbi:DNA repair helicase XPB [Roseofilum casamattae]|uniref:DNA 3'-5' helicase n=1 Tax=Roseofilum casamattae BLCC-M143 TaxID=3022442 RepID=A0ABT7BY82_9CYAN|nr:DNA repair helicase XPB [Roseofilum casamattae]MDJ1184153.1 DEAD/DEAH box helicase [Roseofilum casamattae BLCC-M143]
MSYNPENALIVQSDRTILLETHSLSAGAAREAIAPFAELIKSPEHIHTYRLTPLSIWNARAAGLEVEEMVAALEQHTKYPLPSGVIQEIETLGKRYGLTRLVKSDDGFFLLLNVADEPLAELLLREEAIAPLLNKRLSPISFQVQTEYRGLLKKALIEVGYPAEDLAGYVRGDELPVRLRSLSKSGQSFNLRPYQKEAAETFYQSGHVRGGSGVICLPCGAGKTIVGMAAMAQVQENTLILTTSLTSVRQWKRELIDKTELPPEIIAEYSGEMKATAPVTLATYQILTYRPNKDAEFKHFSLFQARSWGLIIYDEVHLLPAPVFRVTAELQARRRLGLTATLIREDGRETDVFALIGPKRYDVPWRELETQGFIAQATCREIRVPQDSEEQMRYAVAPRRQQFRIAAENPGKVDVVKQLLQEEAGHKILVIGEYIEQLKTLAEVTKFPLITGKTSQKKRDVLYQQFRDGEIEGLVLSRVGNFALDLPDADVLIQVSGKYGSRQEEAQRLGRILRPKSDGRTARFYTLVSLRTCEEDFARHRQLFLTEQGYGYEIN